MDFLFSEVTLWVRILNSLISLANHVLETGPAFYNTVQGSEIFRIIRGKTSWRKKKTFTSLDWSVWEKKKPSAKDLRHSFFWCGSPHYLWHKLLIRCCIQYRGFTNVSLPLPSVKSWSGWYAPPGLDNYNHAIRGATLKKAVVTCGKPPSSPSECTRESGPCLFNVADDPCEYVDLAKNESELVESMLKRLEGFKETMVPPRNQPLDPKANPNNFGGVWSPWMDWGLIDVEEEERRFGGSWCKFSPPPLFPYWEWLGHTELRCNLIIFSSVTSQSCYCRSDLYVDSLWNFNIL